ncbi:MAG: winged helix-turn-helix domain-containing protein [Pseudomonadota bacterium]
MIYRFNRFSLDTELTELHAAGQIVKIEPLVFRLIAHLVANSDRVVGKDELIETVWEGVIVSDAAVNSRINAARKALDDDGKRQAVIKTYSKRGFRFVADVEAAEPTPASPRRPQHSEARSDEAVGTTPPDIAATSSAGAPASVLPSRRMGAGAFLGALIIIGAVILGTVLWQTTKTENLRAADDVTSTNQLPRIAVLPFDDFGGQPSTERLAKGITEDIITDLARFPEFGVIARNSTAVYAGNPADMREIGSDLNVAYVLEGSIQNDGDLFRVTAQLIDTSTGDHVWTDRWDRPADSLFAVQSEISTTVANRLGGGSGVIQETGRAQAKRKLPKDLDAYDLYLLGTEQLEDVTRGSIDKAIALLEQAVAIEPGLARAWVELYHAHNLSRYYGTDKDAALAAAWEAAKKAVALDPGDAEAHAAYAMMLADQGELAAAKASFDEALSISPNGFEIMAFYASWAGSLGEPELGAELAERAIELNPDYPDWTAGPFSWAFFTVGRYDETVELLDRLDPDRFSSARWAKMAGSLAMLGRTEEAATTVESALEYFPDLTIEGLANTIGLTDFEIDMWTGPMRRAGFPVCAASAAREEIAPRYRLPDCETAE